MADVKFVAPLCILFLGLFFVHLSRTLQKDASLNVHLPAGGSYGLNAASGRSMGTGFMGLLRTRGFRSVLNTPYEGGSIKLARSFITLLFLCGDIKLNPGPVKYPCGKCSKPVKSNQKGIQCDFCDYWYHTRCLNIDSITYNALANTSCVWGCTECGLPNYSTTLLSSVSDLQSPNQHSPPGSEDHIPQIPSPPAVSTPSSPPPHYSTPKRPRSKPRNRMKCMEINCNSILSTERAAIFKATVEHHAPDIIFGCESKLSPDTPTGACFPRGYTIYRKERESGSGGGVFLAVANNLTSLGHPEFSIDASNESVWASIKLPGTKALHLCSFYKPPSAPVSRIDYIADVLAELHQRARRSNPFVVVSGDFNIGDINWTTDPPTPSSTSSSTTDTEYLLNFLDEYSLTQSVTQTSRPVSGKTLDLVLSSAPSLVSNVQIHSGMSDHDLITFTINTKPSRVNKPPHKVHLYSRMDLQGLKGAVSSISNEFFNSDPGTHSVNENWVMFKTSLSTAIDMFIPWKMTKAKSSLPWVTKAIKRQMRKRDKLHSLATHSNNPSIKASYRKQRNKVVDMLRSSHSNYVNNEIGGSLESNPKRFWNYVKSCRSESIEVPTLQSGNNLYISSMDKAQVLNKHFESVFVRDDGILPGIGISNYPTIPNLSFHVNGVKKQLSNLNPNKACGPDNLSPRILKLLADDLSPILTFIFQQSYDSGNLPDEWLKALITPVYKKGGKQDPKNYRPISLTCICCKIMEHIVLSHIHEHMSTNNILCKHQHGFRSRLSCETQLVSAIHEWASILNIKGQADVIQLDFSKAFDKVSHPKLLHKLSYYGIHGQTLLWIKGFLSNRSQSVSVNGVHSTPCKVTSGVPQGSVLGPTLFLIYINDIVGDIKSNIRLFADDTIMYRQVASPADHLKLQQDLERLTSWAGLWQMEFNVKKCYHITLTNKRAPVVLPYYMHGQVLEHVTCYDYLGVRLTGKLNWKEHCDKISNKANKSLGLVKRTLKPCTPEVKERSYKALIRPLLEYASAAWNPHTNRDTETIEKVQRRAARFVAHDYRRSTNSQDLVNKLGWDSLESRRLLAQATLFYKIKNKLIDLEFPSSIQPASKSSIQHAMLQPYSSVLAYSYSPFVRTVRVWNKLKTETVQANNISLFKSLAMRDIQNMKTPNHLKRL